MVGQCQQRKREREIEKRERERERERECEREREQKRGGGVDSRYVDCHLVDLGPAIAFHNSR